MKKFLKGKIMSGCTVLASLALMVGISAAGSACWLWQYQPKEPEGMKRFKKFSKKYYFERGDSIVHFI